MAGEELINRIADRNAVKEDYDYVVDLVRKIDELIQDTNRRLAGMQRGPSTSGEARAQTDELVQTNRKLLDVEQQLTRESEKRAQAERAMREGLLASQAATREQTASLKAQAAAVSELVTPYTRLKAQVYLAQEAAKNAGAAVMELTDQFGANSEQVKTAQAEYDRLKQKGFELTDSLKKLEASVGDNRRNVGNYVAAIQTLRPALDEIKARLAQMAAAGQSASKEFSELSRVEQHLSQMVTQQAQGYASLAAEIKAAEKVLAEMYGAGLQGSEAFQKMDLEVRKLHTDLNEFHKRQQLLENDAPILTTLAFAAKGLGGAYAAAMGAQALFADGNEKIEKELSQLVAVMTLVQGLMEATELLKQRDAVLTAAQGVQEKVYTGWLAFKKWILQGTAAAQTEANTATEAAVPASEAATVATEEQAVANVGLAGAEGVATAGAIALRIALTALGIGAVIALIVGIVEAFKAWTSSTEDEVTALKELAEAQKAVTEANKAYRESLDAGGDKYADNLKKQLALMQASGKDQYAILAQQQAIAEHAANTTRSGAQANSRSVQLGRLNQYQHEANEYAHATSLMQDADQRFADTGEDTWKTISENWKKIADAHKAAMEAVKMDYDDGVKANKDYQDAIDAQDVIAAEAAKMHQEDLTKYTALQAKNRYDAIIDNNQKILADERSTEAKRAAALRAVAAAQHGLTQTSLRETLADPSTTTTPGGGADQARAAAAAANAKIDKDLQTALFNNHESFRLRDLQATYDTEKSKLEFISATEEKLSQNNKKSLNDRLAAYAAYVEVQKRLVDLDYDYQVNKAPLLTAEQKGAINQQRTEKKAAVDQTAATNVPQIAKESLDTDFKNTSTGIDTTGINAEIEAYKKLNAEMAKGTITTKEYNEQREKLENNAATKVLELQTSALEALRALYIANGIATMDLDKQIAENKLALIKKVSDADEKAAAKKAANDKEGAKLTQDLTNKTTDLIFSLMDDNVERQKNALQKQQDKAEQSAAFQIEQVNQMNLSDQDRAARVKLIQAEEAIQKENFARQQRKLDQEKAKFDKAASITRIIEATAVAATEALSYGPISGEIFAALIIAAGAVELAKVAATPIPQYAGGTGISGTPRSGLARVSERGQELGILPGGGSFMTPSNESTMFLPKGTRIIPHHEVADYLGEGYAGDLRVLAGHPDPGGRQLENLTSAVNKQTDKLVKGLEKLDKTVNVHVHAPNAGWISYLNTQL